MIISKTPFRISFFGGGTDFREWFEEHGGAVLSTTINKYCYLTCRYLPPFFEHRYRVVYSAMEYAKSLDEIKHVSVRETVRFVGIRDGLEIHHDGDLPARTGLGASSAFTVGLLHALYALKGVMPAKMRLAREAIRIEQDLNKEPVGCQDQTAAAMGGFNRISFGGNDHLNAVKVIMGTQKYAEFQDHLMLFFTGLSRNAEEIVKEHIRNIPRKKQELGRLQRMVDEAVGILGGGDLTPFGELLHEAWSLKKGLSNGVSTPWLDEIYQAARDAGALGGKLCGAGGGGFFLFFVRPEDQPAVKARLGRLLHIPFKLEDNGSQIIFYQPEEPVPGPV